MKINYGRFLKLNEIMMQLLIDFVNTEMTAEEFIQKNKPVLKELLNHSVEISEDELGKSYEHEMKHKEIWDKYGIKTQFRKNHWGGYLTMDIDFDKKAKKMSKEEIIKILKEVCYAPYAKGHPFERCKTDLFKYEILSKRQLNPQPTDEDFKRIKQKYYKVESSK